MGLFPALAIVIVVLVIIIIIVVIAVIVSNGSTESSSDNSCSNNSDCKSGYVCVNTGNSGGTCKAGTGTSCSSDSDCATNLVCLNNVCSAKPPPPTRKEVSTINTNKKRVSWAKTQLSSAVLPPPPSPVVEQTIVEQMAAQNAEVPKVIEPIQPQITLAVTPPQSCTPLTNDVKSATTPVTSHSERKPTIRPIMNKTVEIDSVTPLTDFRVVTGHGIASTTANSRSVVIQRTPQGIQQRSRTNQAPDVTPIDDEINSDGTRSDAPFDVRSGASTPDSTRVGHVSTPCEERDGVFYCRSNKASALDGNIDHSPVINVCSYSNATVFLLMNGNAICEVDSGTAKKRYRATNSVTLQQMTSYDGYLYGVSSDHKLYTLPNSHFTNTNWIWNLVDWAPDNVIHISSTHDASHLWIQTDTHGYLYGSSGSLISKISYIGMRRVYGRNVNHYLDIDDNKYTATIYPGNTIVNNIVDAALSYYDEVVAIHPSEATEYRGVTIVNWKPYYIRA